MYKFDKKVFNIFDIFVSFHYAYISFIPHCMPPKNSQTYFSYSARYPKKVVIVKRHDGQKLVKRHDGQICTNLFLRENVICGDSATCTIKIAKG